MHKDVRFNSTFDSHFCRFSFFNRKS